MTIEAQIKAMRDEAEADSRNTNYSTVGRSQFDGLVIAFNRVLALLDVETDAAQLAGFWRVVKREDVLAEVEGVLLWGDEEVWIARFGDEDESLKFPSDVFPEKVRPKLKSGDLPVCILILARDACPHCAKPLVKEVASGEEGTNHYVCKECKEPV